MKKFVTAWFLLLLFLMTIFWPVFFGGKAFFFGDNFTLMVPGKLFAVDVIKHEKVIPFWQPYSFSGAPYLADINQSLFYPTTLLFYFLEPGTATNVTVLIHLFIGGMGMGDIKLLAVSGFLLGWKLILLTMLVSSVIAAIFGIYLMITKKAGRKSEIPFGPYIAFAVIICLLVGNNIINFYLNFLGVK